MEKAISAIKGAILENRCSFFLGNRIPTEAGLIDTGTICKILGGELPNCNIENDLLSISQEYANRHSENSLKKLIKYEIENQLENSSIELTHKLKPA